MMRHYIWLFAFCTAALLVSACGTQKESSKSPAQKITLEQEVKITDVALFFDGEKMGSVKESLASEYEPNQKYNYQFGSAIVPHGDAIKVHKEFVFMTWYQGGKYNRHMVLSRLNLKTGQLKHIQFPHQHTGFWGRWWIGETHNTIAVGISPLDETIHLVFDLHAYSRTSDTGGHDDFTKDYFRYAFTLEGAASVSDEDFNLDLFVKDTSAHREGENDYNHLSMNGGEDHPAYSRLTYPKFFLNDKGGLFLYIRQGGSKNGKGVFNAYEGQGRWSDFKSINKLSVIEDGEDYNWSNYGKMKFANGTLGFGFQRRLNNPQDKYKYQNGLYFMTSDDPAGQSAWKNYRGEPISLPLIDAAPAFVMEPGDWVETQQKDSVVITGGFDWNITERGDVHIVSRVRDFENNKTVHLHHYKAAGQTEFITSDDFVGASKIYTSGDNIYIIGLENGQPYIERAKGGTNAFTRVYHGSPRAANFTKGMVHIANGKLYYYLLAEGQGDKRTTYLQVIDLSSF
jgi:hypothetical protein